MNVRMDQMPKNTSILIILRAIRISAVERFSVILYNVTVCGCV